MRNLLAFAGFALLAAPLPAAAAFPVDPDYAAACSLAPGYRIPTNMELVERADLILLGTVTGDNYEPGSNARPLITVVPVAALKGSMPAGPITLPGRMESSALMEFSNPYELHQPHRQSFTGGCGRFDFPRSSRVLFFLDRQAGAWVGAGGPFSRWAEDVLTDDAPWLQAVRFYVDVAKLPEDERTAMLTARKDELGALSDDPVAQLIAVDIGRQLQGPNEPLGQELPVNVDPQGRIDPEPTFDPAEDAAPAEDALAEVDAPRV